MNKLGDANSDGRLSVIDVGIVYDYIFGKVTLTDQEKFNIDMDGSGNVNVIDIGSLYDVIFNKPNDLATFKLKFDEANRTVKLQMNASWLSRKNNTGSAVGMVLYLKGINLATRTDATSYLNASEKNAALANWIVAANTIDPNNNISIMYLENDNPSIATTGKLTPSNGVVELATFKYTSKEQATFFYSDDTYKSVIADINGDGVVNELDFTI